MLDPCLVFPVLLLTGAVGEDLYQYGSWPQTPKYSASSCHDLGHLWEGRQLSCSSQGTSACIDACDLCGRLTLHLAALREICNPFCSLKAQL